MKSIKVAAVLLLSCFMALSAFPSVINADTIVTAGESAAIEPNEAGINSYDTYLQQYSKKKAGSEEFVLFSGEEKALTSNDVLDLSFDIPEEALYQIKITYKSTERKNTKIAVKINDRFPFENAKDIQLPVHYRDNGEVRVDGNGNEFAPEQIIADEYVSVLCRDSIGEYEDPYVFYLADGNQKISICINDGNLIVERIAIVPKDDALPYCKPDDVKDTPVEDVIVIEGEAATLKSTQSLISLSDDSSCNVNPSSPTNSVINYIGGSNWSGPNDTLQWNFNIKQSGYYSLGFMYRQAAVIGGVSYRHLKIDDVTPFEEAKKLKFKYSSNWKYMDYGKEKDNYLIFLGEGEHTLSLSVTAGEFTDIYRRLKDITTALGDLYVEITKVVGETVDVGRSYELFHQIPEFNERLKNAAEGLKQIANDLEVLQEKKSGSNVSSIRNTVITLEKMYNNPYSAHRYKSAYYTGYTNLSALLKTITNMPVDIDRIFLIGNGSDYTNPSSSFFEKLTFGFLRFLDSFAGSYNVANDRNDAINIWVNWGREQTQVIDSIIQSKFVKSTGVPVNFKLVNASLIQAILAGDGPDVMLKMPRTEPVNLAMRGALVDLTQFEDFEETLSRFTNDAQVPFEYGDGVYALPDTMEFYMMFVRTDILSEMGLEIPTTWEEFIYTLTILQHNNLQVYMPSGLYTTMLLQSGLDLYNEDRTASMLTGEKQIILYSDWIKFYTKYKVPVTMDFYNRFRVGSVPIGIFTYTLYTQLKAAAPEIDGRWIVTLIPGTTNENGEISHVSAGSGEGCGITKLSKNPENAWLFLKWWTEADTQLKYSENLESLLGPLGRVATANTDALKRMGWDAEMLDMLNKHLDLIVQIPELPGGYYTSRGLDQVFWNVVESNKNPTDMMLEWGAIVDAEIERKRNEYAN